MVYTLTNGVAAAAKDPDRFFIPTSRDRTGVKAGQYIKLRFNYEGYSESMWVKVTKGLCYGVYHGTLDNKPVSLLRHLLDIGDKVLFKPDHIIAIEVIN